MERCSKCKAICLKLNCRKDKRTKDGSDPSELVEKNGLK